MLSRQPFHLRLGDAIEKARPRTSPYTIHRFCTIGKADVRTHREGNAAGDESGKTDPPNGDPNIRNGRGTALDSGEKTNGRANGTYCSWIDVDGGAYEVAGGTRSPRDKYIRMELDSDVPSRGWLGRCGLRGPLPSRGSPPESLVAGRISTLSGSAVHPVS